MTFKSVFHDENGNELSCHLDDNKTLCVYVGKIDPEDPCAGDINLNKTDTEKLIKSLEEFLKEMKAD